MNEIVRHLGNIFVLTRKEKIVFQPQNDQFPGRRCLVPPSAARQEYHGSHWVPTMEIDIKTRVSRKKNICPHVYSHGLLVCF